MLTSQLLQSSSEAPCGLQFHVLDVYLSELAAEAADEVQSCGCFLATDMCVCVCSWMFFFFSLKLTADQNLVFIEPFCKTAARTKE